MEDRKIRELIRDRYGKIARESGSCCGPSSSCCGSDAVLDEGAKAERFGYSRDELTSVPESSNLGLGCGNPTAHAAIREGDTVLDLGSGAGFDCFLAARRVGAEGRVIGVDMTPAMIEKARENAEKAKAENVEFRLGEIENLPVADSSVDLIISNCVINLSVDKPRVFREAFRVLKPGGKLMISDIVLLSELPQSVMDSAAAYAGCVAGALKKEDYLAAISEARLENLQVIEQKSFSSDLIVETTQSAEDLSPDQAREAAAQIVSISVSAAKPTGE
jgi:SAM-dependent methyltransferase